MEYGLGVIFLFIFVIAIMVAISRWIFRINDIIKRMDKIIELLGNSSRKSEKPTSFMDGFKKGME